MTIHSLLTAAQQTQAAYLFADEHFGTDPTAYEYELDGASVIGRVRIGGNGDADRRVRKPHTVRVNVITQEVPDTYITIEMNRQSETAIQEIARRLLHRAISQPQEA